MSVCGIIGYVGNKPAVEILKDALTRLEYRGYDSAGIATISGGKVHLCKDKGKVADVIETCSINNLPGNIGIGHVRWATHGSVTRENAHPHCDALSQIAVIHNGIIENYEELKERLVKQYKFQSDTDTEVIPHLIREQIDSGLNFEDAFFAAVRQLQGSFAIIVISTLADGKLFAARKDSPMVLGIGKDANFVGSDVLSFLPYTREAVYIEDGDCVVMTKNSYQIYDFDQHQKQRASVNITWDLSEAGKGDYAHFMIKEIKEQPAVIRQALMQDDRQLNRMAIDILRSRQVIFVACGSSRFAALIGRYAFSRVGHTFSDVVMASEFGYFSDSVDKNTLVIAISQSGETADVMNGVKQAKAKGATVYSIINVEGSSLARMSDKALYLSCGPEIGVAATKSFTAQLCLLYLLAYAMDGRLTEGKEKLLEISALIEDDLQTNTSEIAVIAEKFKDKKDFYFLARGINFAMAGEGALKLKEVCYVHAEGMAAGELKHGTLALIEEGTPVVAICPTDYTYADIISNVSEARVRGATVIGISNTNQLVFDEWIKIPEVEMVFYPLVTVIPLQLLAYHSAIVRGFDPDKPRNLAKSVTVK
jgi:glucosamine--fructose-6-phosphate aminotransferase (isomerizing)